MLPSLRLAVAGALVAVAGVRAIPQAAPTTSSAAASSTDSASSDACNNSPSLCSKKYNEVTYLGAHDSAFLRDDSTDNSIAGNQYLNATRALDAGLRLLQAQVHDEDGALQLCHTSCNILDAGPLTDWLSGIADWMGENPSEVVTVLLVNSDDHTADDFGKSFNDSGLSAHSYTPPTTEATGDWPTLQDMIAQDTRLVSFVTDVDPSTAYPFILSEFDFVFETSFEVTELSGFNCTLDRPSRIDSASEAISRNYMSLLNHFKYQSLGAGIMLTDVDAIDTINSAGSAEGNLGAHLDACADEYGAVPNFILVDFWNEADPLDAVDSTNGLDDITGRTEASTNDTGDDEGAAVNLDARNLGHGALLAFIAAALVLV